MSGELGLRELLDQAEITKVITYYANAVDDRDWVRFRSLFADDAELDYTAAHGITGGPDQVTDWISVAMTLELVPYCMHAITNVLVQIDGDEASATAYLLNADVMAAEADEQSLLLNGGRYAVQFSNSGHGWLISRLVAEVIFSHRGKLERFVAPDPIRAIFAKEGK